MGDALLDATNINTPVTRPTFRKSLGAMSLGTLTNQGLSFLQGILYRRILGPEVVGVFNLVQLIQGYLDRSTLGPAAGGERIIPMDLGAGRTDEADRIRKQMTTFLVFEGVLLALGAVTYLVYAKAQLSPYLAWGLAAAAINIFLFRLASAYQVSYRTLGEFVVVGRTQMVSSAATFTVVVGGAHFFGYFGLIAGTAASLLTQIALLEWTRRRRRVFDLAAEAPSKSALRLFRVGAPLTVAGFIWGVFVSLDSILVTKLLGTTALAYYALALTFSRYISEIPTQVGSILNPRVLSSIGRRGFASDAANDLDRFLVGNLTLTVPAVMIAGFVGIPLVVHLLVPTFSDAIPVAHVLLFSLLFLPQSHILGNVLIALGRSFQYIALNVLGVALVGLAVLAATGLLGPSLSAIALGAVVGQGVYFLILLLSSGRSFTTGRRLAEYVTILALCGLLMLWNLWVAQQLLGYAGGTWLGRVLAASAAGVICVACWLPFALWGDRRAGTGLWGLLGTWTPGWGHQ